MMRLCSVRFVVAVALGSVGIFSASLVSAEASDVAGVWRGASVCVTDAPTCHNEDVVYYIKDVRIIDALTSGGMLECAA